VQEVFVDLVEAGRIAALNIYEKYKPLVFLITINQRVPGSSPGAPTTQSSET
jgi:hypothetical protein